MGRSHFRRGVHPPAGLRATALALGCVAVALPGCSDGGPTRPPEASLDRDTLLIAFAGDSARLDLVGGQSGTLLGRRLLEPGESGNLLLGLAVDPNRHLAFVVVSGELLAVSLPELEVLTRQPLELVLGGAASGLTVFTGDPELDLVTGRLFLSADREGTDGSLESGIAVVDLEASALVTFLGSFSGLATATVVEDGEAGERRIVVAGGRGPDVSRLMIYDAEDLTLLDSVGIPREVPSVKPASAGDGRFVFGQSRDSVFKVDVLAARRVVTEERTEPIGPVPIEEFAVVQDPLRLFVIDRDPSFGSGFLRVYDGELRHLASVDLRSDVVQDGQGIPAMVDAAVGERGDRVFVVSGSARGGHAREPHP